LVTLWWNWSPRSPIPDF